MRTAPSPSLRVLRLPIAALVAAALSACASGRGGPPERTFAHRAAYRVSCSVTDECRVTFIDEDGDLDAQDIVGEWTRDLGADGGARLWVRVGAGGCPPRPVRVEIVVDGETVSEDLARAPGAARCEWILAETDYRVP